MKVISLFVIAAVLALSVPAKADQHVEGYYRSNGTYVQPYNRSEPNGTVTDNYSYTGNVNPNTGSIGTNNYPHDTTSPQFNGSPNSNGQYGHPNGQTLGGN